MQLHSSLDSDYNTSTPDTDVGRPGSTDIALPNHRPRDIDVLVAAVVGSVGGFLAIVVTALLTRYCLLHHRSQPEPGFEVDEEVTTDQIQPFSNPDSTVQKLTTNLDTKSKTESGRRPPESSSGPSTHSESNSPLKFNERTATTAQSHSCDPLDPQPNHPPTTPVSSGSQEAASVRRRTVHEQDAGDVDILLPMYREAWADRHQVQLQDGATAATRAEIGNRADDAVGPYNEKNRKQ